MITDHQLHTLAERLIAVPGITAVVLGGSRARGTHRPDSDVDLGLYYDADALDLESLAEVAREAGDAPAELAGPGGWGPWVDGGAWLRVEGVAVDLILRDVAQVREQRERAIRGEFAVHQQTGHPLGFLDVAYAGEAATCRPLADPDELIPTLREGLVPYPPALRDALVEHLWSAAFVVAGARKGTGSGDLAFLQLSCAQALLWCAHAWHAHAGVWATTEKGLIPAVARLPVESSGFSAAATGVLSRLTGADAAELGAAVDDALALVRATQEILRP